MQHAIVLFRQDLRIFDNPALSYAADNAFVLPVYIIPKTHKWAEQGNSQEWLYQSLAKLNDTLGGRLVVHTGDVAEVLEKLISLYNINLVVWNRCYEPWRIEQDKQIKSDLRSKNIEVKTFNATLLWEPWDILNKEGQAYKVYTPFYRKGCLQAQPPREPLQKPSIQYLSHKEPAYEPLKPSEVLRLWDVGEAAAKSRLEQFIEAGLSGYKELRDIPADQHTSRLSPHLHWGEISPHTVWHAVKEHGDFAPMHDSDHYLSEIGWREFAYYQLYHFPQLPEKNWQSKFDHFPWGKNEAYLLAWQKGQTGFPIIDAAMMELVTTGYMHNRMRMVTASFLVKNLLIDWREGEKWFWQHLVDADLASNSASWQWVAGSGVDAAPYFRIFNPVLQSKKFDGQGLYIKKHLPQLAHVDPKYLHDPTLDPSQLPLDYPKPIVDLAKSRDIALAAYQHIKDSS